MITVYSISKLKIMRIRRTNIFSTQVFIGISLDIDDIKTIKVHNIKQMFHSSYIIEDLAITYCSKGIDEHCKDSSQFTLLRKST